MCCGLEATLADQPPRRLWCEEKEDGERGWEQPLKSDGDSVGGLCWNCVVAVGDATNDDATDSPEHLEHLGGRGSELDGDDLRAVRRGIGDEDTPWQTLEKLGDKHERKGVGKVEDEDETVQAHETDDGGPAVSDAAGERTSKEDSNEGAELSSHLKCRLP